MSPECSKKVSETDNFFDGGQQEPGLENLLIFKVLRLVS